MAQVETIKPVALLGTVVLLLDDEAEAVGSQLARQIEILDPLVRARLTMLRVSREDTHLVTRAFGHSRQMVLAEAQAQRRGGSDPHLVLDLNATQTVETIESALGPPRRFDDGMRAAIQEALHTGGAEPLAGRGYALASNTLVVHLIGRMDSPLLPEVAEHTQAITRTISAQTDALRFALLIAAAPAGEMDRAITPPAHARAPMAGNRPAWQERAAAQPWRALLSWDRGEPPLHYAFLFEPWDESGRYHERPQCITESPRASLRFSPRGC